MSKCWNCGSENFIDIPSMEYCPDCGICCDYHGKGANDKYNKAAAKYHESDWERHCREMEEENEWNEDNPYWLG